MALCAISLGGNLGDVPRTFAQAASLLAASGRIVDLKSSRSFRTAPMGADAGGEFLNAAAVFQTDLAPPELLDLLQQIETRCGRVRTVRWGPRTLDLDLLLYGGEIIHSPRLIVPHPALWYRRFVLDPLVELIPDAVHPVFQQTVRQLRERLLERPLPVALIGGTPVRRAELRDAVEFDRNLVRWLDESRSLENAALIFALTDAMQHLPRRILVDEEHTAQTVTDVLTAALDEPLPWPEGSRGAAPPR